MICLMAHSTARRRDQTYDEYQQDLYGCYFPSILRKVIVESAGLVGCDSEYIIAFIHTGL